jgi:hypothetical protein
MSSPRHVPTSLVGIKRLAKQIASEKSLQHTAALDEAAKAAGYQTFLHAKRALTEVPRPPQRSVPAEANARSSAMPYSDFHLRARSNWVTNINRVAPTGNASVTWEGIDQICDALRPFMGRNANHAHLPTGGGFDFRRVEFSASEHGCLDFHVDGPIFVTVKPKRLYLERIDRDPAESFLVLELHRLEPSGIYDEDRNRHLIRRRQEEVVDVGDDGYVQRNGTDYGFYYDRDGYQHDLPENYRRVMRFLDGKIMLVTKGSIWNGLSETYNGTHDAYSASEIRGLVDKLIDRRDAA